VKYRRGEGRSVSALCLKERALLAKYFSHTWNKESFFLWREFSSAAPIIAEVDKEYLDSSNDIKISMGAIKRALQRGGEVSSLKAERKVSVPHNLTCALVTHSTMMQVAGDGEACAANMKSVMSKYNGKIDVEYL
jgi:hypothetical protein